MSKEGLTPFNGDYYDSNGNVRNLIENGEAPAGHPKRNMAVRNGDFYASNGEVHNIDELGGGSPSPTPETERLLAALNWEDIKASRTVGVEVWTGAMAGEDKVYGKVVDLGILPSTNTVATSANISNFKKWIGGISGVAVNTKIANSYPIGALTIPLPLPHSSTSLVPMGYESAGYASKNIYVTTLNNSYGSSGWGMNGYAFITYTCTDR